MAEAGKTPEAHAICDSRGIVMYGSARLGVTCQRPPEHFGPHCRRYEGVGEEHESTGVGTYVAHPTGTSVTVRWWR